MSAPAKPPAPTLEWTEPWRARVRSLAASEALVDRDPVLRRWRTSLSALIVAALILLLLMGEHEFVATAATAMALLVAAVLALGGIAYLLLLIPVHVALRDERIVITGGFSLSFRRRREYAPVRSGVLYVMPRRDYNILQIHEAVEGDVFIAVPKTVSADRLGALLPLRVNDLTSQ